MTETKEVPMRTAAEKLAVRNMGAAYTNLKTALEQYCEAYAAISEDPDTKVGDDGYAGPLVADMLAGMVGLLSCEIGALDGGTEDRAIRAIAAAHHLIDKNGDIGF